MKKSKKEIRNRILTFTKKKGVEKSVSASEVAKDLFSDVWKDHVDEVRTMADELQNEKLISKSQDGEEIRVDKASGSIRLSLMKTPKRTK